MKSVANILSGEFLADIQQCCARCKNDDDTDVLVQYLLEGRGWMILDVLTNIGVEVRNQDLFQGLKPGFRNWVLADMGTRNDRS